MSRLLPQRPICQDFERCNAKWLSPPLNFWDAFYSKIYIVRITQNSALLQLPISQINHVSTIGLSPHLELQNSKLTLSPSISFPLLSTLLIHYNIILQTLAYCSSMSLIHYSIFMNKSQPKLIQTADDSIPVPHITRFLQKRQKPRKPVTLQNEFLILTSEHPFSVKPV